MKKKPYFELLYPSPIDVNHGALWDWLGLVFPCFQTYLLHLAASLDQFQFGAFYILEAYYLIRAWDSLFLEKSLPFRAL